MKAGIIGFGYMGHFHLRRTRECGSFEVTAVYDSSAEKRADAEQEGLKAYDRLEDFLADGEIGFVFICTPNDSHAALSIATLNAGKHVMCEKPVTMNGAELEQVIACAEKNGRIFTVHQNRRWDEDYLAVREVVRSGEIGNITTIVSRVFGQRGVCFGWRADSRAGGGMLYDWGIHLIDQCLCLFEGHKVTSVYARLLSILTPEVDDHFELQLIFDNEVCAKIQVGTFSLQELPRWMVYGDRGTLKLNGFSAEDGAMARIRREVSGYDSVFGKAYAETGSGVQIGPSRTMAPLQPEYLEKLALPTVQADPYEYHRNLAAAAAGLEAPHVTHEQMRRSMKIIDTAFESSKQNQVIRTDI